MSVMSTLIGIAIGQGKISGVNATLRELLPSLANVMTPDVAAITLEQLLTHTANLPADRSANETFMDASDWIKAILEQRAAAGPGTRRFVYSNAGPHMLSAILVQATGRSVLDFAREYLFGRLGIPTEPATDVVLGRQLDVTQVDSTEERYQTAAFAWPVDPQGFQTGAAHLKLRPKDLAAIGLAYLAGGRSPKGKQVIPANWIATATVPHVDDIDRAQGYGYLWWIFDADGSPAFAACGLGGQLIEVVPDRGLVVVVATRYSELDPKRELRKIQPEALAAMVSTWIAPQFPASGQ